MTGMLLGLAVKVLKTGEWSRKLNCVYTIGKCLRYICSSLENSAFLFQKILLFKGINTVLTL